MTGWVILAAVLPLAGFGLLLLRIRVPGLGPPSYCGTCEFYHHVGWKGCRKGKGSDMEEVRAGKITEDGEDEEPLILVPPVEEPIEAPVEVPA